MNSVEWPYNLPIWRRSHREVSPNGDFTAEISLATEVSMGNPTSGEFKLSDGIVLPSCNPSFIWSDDSRYLAVPQYFDRFGLFRRQRMTLIDVETHGISRSRETTYYFQPDSFASGVLVATCEPFHSAKKISWNVPDDFPDFELINPTTKNA